MGEDAQIPCPGNRLCPVAGIEFAIDVARVDLDRVEREVQPVGDLLIREPFCDVLEYFKFAFT